MQFVFWIGQTDCKVAIYLEISGVGQWLLWSGCVMS